MPERLIGTLFRGHLIALALLGSCSKSAQGQQASWKTYVDTLHGYALDYPPAYLIREEFHTLWLTDGRLRTEVYIEDWTKPVTRGQDRWDLASLAADRADASCMADGPDCSTSCKVRNVEDVPNSHGVRVVVVTRRRFDTCEHPDTALTIDPLYVADLSGGGKYYLLILGSILDQPGVPIETVRSIVATIRRVGEQRR